MEFGIFNLMGARDPRTPTTQIFRGVSEQVALADRPWRQPPPSVRSALALASLLPGRC